MSVVFEPFNYTPLEDLTMGLAKLRSLGWIQGVYYDDDGCCATGALYNVDYSAGMPYLKEAILDSGWMPVSDVLTDPHSWGSASVVIQWNDTPGRTWEEVEAVFEAAIELAAAELVPA